MYLTRLSTCACDREDQRGIIALRSAPVSSCPLVIASPSCVARSPREGCVWNVALRSVHARAGTSIFCPSNSKLLPFRSAPWHAAQDTAYSDAPVTSPPEALAVVAAGALVAAGAAVAGPETSTGSGVGEGGTAVAAGSGAVPQAATNKGKSS